MVGSVGAGVLLPRQRRHARAGTGVGDGRLLPAAPICRSVRRRHAGRLRRLQAPAATATDPVGNMTTAGSDYRVLQPVTVTDPNGNRVRSPSTHWGWCPAPRSWARRPRASATRCPASPPTWTRRRCRRLRRPAGDPAVDSRERHHPHPVRPGRLLADPRRPRSRARPRSIRWAAKRTSPIWRERRGPGAGTTRYQHAFAYGDGFGREIQRTARAGPDAALLCRRDGSPLDGQSTTTRTSPVRKYEPFFTAANAFEFAAGRASARSLSTIRPAAWWLRCIPTAPGKRPCSLLAPGKLGRQRHGPDLGPARRS